jgi:hypothetical protein
MRRSPSIPFELRAVQPDARLVLERREAIDRGVEVNWGFRAGTEIPLCETALTLTTHTAAQLSKKLAKDCGRH